MNVTLYGLDKGKDYKLWKISVLCDGSSVAIRIEHGKVGGKMQVKTEFVTEGKSNRTVYQQAVLQANARVKKQKDKGYRESIEELNSLPILPMLASDYRKQGHRIEYPCWGSPKLDGVRCLAFRTSNGVELKSRTGQPYNVPHIQEQLTITMREGEIWDGELYIHGKYLEEIVSAVKKPNANSPSIEFVIFDIVSPLTYQYRLIELEAIRRNRLAELDVPRLTAINIVELHSEDHMKQMHKVWVESGYEGIMLRNYCGEYEAGKRSADLQKYKEFFDEEFEIVGVEEDKNGNAVLCVFDPIASASFTVCYGDFEQRKHQLDHSQEYIGKRLTVKYQTRYKDSMLPQFPTGVVIRNYE